MYQSCITLYSQDVILIEKTVARISPKMRKSPYLFLFRVRVLDGEGTELTRFRDSREMLSPSPWPGGGARLRPRASD